jgi:hypothetical protein
MPAARLIFAHDDARPSLSAEPDSPPCTDIERRVAETDGKIDFAIWLAGGELNPGSISFPTLVSWSIIAPG